MEIIAKTVMRILLIFALNAHQDSLGLIPHHVFAVLLIVRYAQLIKVDAKSVEMDIFLITNNVNRVLQIAKIVKMVRTLSYNVNIVIQDSMLMKC